jgi:hypothetical protein
MMKVEARDDPGDVRGAEGGGGEATELVIVGLSLSAPPTSCRIY